MTIAILILTLAVILLSAPYTLKGSLLQVSIVSGFLIGAAYDSEEFEEDNETLHTFQVALMFILFTVTYSTYE